MELASVEPGSSPDPNGPDSRLFTSREMPPSAAFRGRWCVVNGWLFLVRNTVDDLQARVEAKNSPNCVVYMLPLRTSAAE